MSVAVQELANSKMCFNVFKTCINQVREKNRFFYSGNNIYTFYKDSRTYICIMNTVINMSFVVLLHTTKIVEKEFKLHENESKQLPVPFQLSE